MEIAAVVVAVLLGGVALFQLALVMGVPWGGHAYGGRADVVDGRVQGAYRAMSVAAIPILVFAALVVLSRADIGSWFDSDGWVGTAVWVVFAYLVVNTAANLASTSKIERFGMGSLTAVAAVGTLIVAVSA